MKKPKGYIYKHVPGILNDYLDHDFKVLEIGCGIMQYKKLLNCEYYGLETPTCSRIIEKPHYIGYCENIEEKNEIFDIVFAVATFFEIENINDAFIECNRVLKKGGYLFIFDYPEDVTKYLSIKHIGYFTNNWNFKKLSEILCECNFKIDGIIDHSPKADRFISKLEIKLRKMIKRSLPSQKWLIVSARK